MTTKIVNDALLATLDTIYPRLTDSALAWGKVIGMFQNSLGLRGLWPMAVSTGAGHMIDVSGNGLTLTRTAGPTQSSRGLVSYINLSGVGQWYARADETALDLVGSETWILTGSKGITVGGWFSLDRLTANEGMIVKGDMAAATTNYALLHRGDLANDPVQFNVSDGVNLYAVDFPSVSLTDWHFCVGRYVANTSLDVYVDLDKATNPVGAIGPANNSALGFYVGAINGASPLDGRVSMAFIAGAALTDAYIRSLYYHSRALYGR